MVPHIVFHIPAPDYSPGPELWDSAACEQAPSVPTSGLTQPPVLATAVRVLHEASPDRSFLEEVVPALELWHAWFHSERGLDSGLVAIVHPWEGADNSPRFDRALARLEVDGELDFTRTDRQEIDASERPTDSDYRALPLPRPTAASPGLPADSRRLAFRLRRSHPQLDPRSCRARPGLALERARRRRSAGERRFDAPARRSRGPLGRERSRLRRGRRRSGGSRRDDRRDVPAVRRRSTTGAGAPAFRRGALVAGAVRPLARRSLAGDLRLEGEPCVRSEAVLARPRLGERELVLHQGARAVRTCRRRQTSCDG